jgi:chaperone required for assembly of F1-ATPase
MNRTTTRLHKPQSKSPKTKSPLKSLKRTIKTKKRQQSTTHSRSFLIHTSTSAFSTTPDEKDSLDPNIAYSMAGHNSEQGVKRWYRSIDVAQDVGDQWAVLLNGRYARTHRNNRLIVPTKAYALACAMEFENQTTFMIPHTMPLVEMAKIAIDRTPAERADLTDNIMAIFNCDSATMRGKIETHPALARAQAKVFDPMIAFVNKEFDVEIENCSDFWGSDQTDDTNDKIFQHINSLNPYQFITLDNITALGKSAIVGLNFLHNNINIEQALRGSLMEEYYQMKIAGTQVGDTYGTWLLDASSRHRCASHRQAMVLLDFKLDDSSNWKM